MGVEVLLHLFLASAVDNVSGQLHGLIVLFLGSIEI
jgi:hypothetical protein